MTSTNSKNNDKQKDIPNKDEIHKVFNYLRKLFGKASELQIYCGEDKSLDVFQRLGYREQYGELQKSMFKILDIMENHDFDLKKIFETALNPKLDPDGKDQYRTTEKMLQLPERVNNWEELRDKTIEDLIKNL